MIKPGSCFYYKGKSCIIGAVISLNEFHYMVAASHIFKGAGDCVEVDGMRVVVTHVLKDFDLALIELPTCCNIELTDFGSAAVLEDAFLVNDNHVIKCRVLNAGSSLLYLSFPCSDMPQPEDIVSPILQAGKVIGFISSALLTDCMGVAISSDVLRSMRGVQR
jgi:hypothetical protein